jgi:hypothetical protein
MVIVKQTVLQAPALGELGKQVNEDNRAVLSVYSVPVYESSFTGTSP